MWPFSTTCTFSRQSFVVRVRNPGQLAPVTASLMDPAGGTETAVLKRRGALSYSGTSNRRGFMTTQKMRKTRTLPPAAGGEHWPFEGKERQDFFHRPRQFPPSVKLWRKRLVEGTSVSSPFTDELDRDTVDRFISEIREIDRILAVLHGTPDLENKSDLVDELVYIILSRKTREDAYQAAFEALKAKFRTWDDLLDARPSSVERLIHGGGLERKKTVSVIGALTAIRERFGNCTLAPAESWTDDELVAFLRSLPEIEKKSALCVLMYSMGREVFPVDTHVQRILRRLGVFRQLGVELEGLDHKKPQTVLEDLVPPPLRYSLHVNLVVHGREVCRSRKPQCESCELARFCDHRRSEVIQESEASDAPTSVDLFCGAGGLSQGFKRAGCRTIMAADLDEAALRTFRLNHPEVPRERVVATDLAELDVGDFLELTGGENPDVLIAAPPCQGFSQAGHRSRSSASGYRTADDDRNYLYECVAHAAAELRPRLLLLENVPGMKSAKQLKRSFIEHAAKRIEEETGHQYETTIWRLNATEFGVPQDRTRYFIVGWRHGHVAPALPPADYQDRNSREYDLDALPPMTLAEAIYDLPPVAPGEGTAVNLRHPGEKDRRSKRYLDKFGIRRGELLLNHSVRYHNERDIELYGLLQPGEDSVHAIERYGRDDLMRYRTDVFDDKYSRLRPDRPSKTMVAHLAKDGNGYVHPEQARSITMREAARLQSFEDDYAFCGSPSQQWIQLGNSVPPVMAEAIGRSFMRALAVEDAR